MALAGSCRDHTVDQSQSSDLVYASDTLKDRPLASLERRGTEAITTPFLLIVLGSDQSSGTAFLTAYPVR